MVKLSEGPNSKFCDMNGGDVVADKKSMHDKKMLNI